MAKRRGSRPSPSPGWSRDKPPESTGPVRQDTHRKGVRNFLVVMLALQLGSRPLFPSEGADLGDGVAAVMLGLGSVLLGVVFALGRPKWTFRLTWVDVALGGVVLWTVLAAVRAAFWGTPRPALNMLWEWVNYLVLWGLIRQLCLGPRERRAIMAGMLSVAVGVASYGLYQYFVELPALRTAYRERKTELLREIGWEDLGEDPVRLSQLENRLFSREPLGTFALTNSLAGFLLPWTLILGSVLLGKKRGISSTALQRLTQSQRELGGIGKADRADKWAQILHRLVLGKWPVAAGQLACLAVLLLCLILTKSRSAYVGLVVGAMLLLFHSRRVFGKLPRGIMLIALAVVLGLGALVALTRGVDWEVLSEAGKSLGYRWQYWQSTLGIIAEHPLLGCGPGNFRYAYTRYKLPEASEEISDPHNFLLEVAATAGIPAAICLVLALGSVLAIGVECLQNPREKQRDAPETSSGSENVDPGAAAIWSPSLWRELWPIGLGWVLAWPVGYWLGLLSSAPQDGMFLAVGLPAASLGLAVSLPWITRGTSSPVFTLTALLALAINWLAAGAIGFPGVAGSFWLLWAITLEEARQTGGANQEIIPSEKNPASGREWLGRLFGGKGLVIWLPAWWGFAFLALVGTVIGLFYRTAYAPVLQCRSLLNQANSAQRLSLEQARQLYEEAARADPWAYEPWMRLLDIWSKETGPRKTASALQDGGQAGREPGSSAAVAERDDSRGNLTPDRRKRLEHYAEELLKRSPNNHAAAWAVAIAYRQLFDESQDPQALHRAIAMARKAAELYPHQAQYRVGLAELLVLAGEVHAAQVEARTALWLHEVTPHSDRKLPEQTLRRLNEILGGPRVPSGSSR